MNRLLCLFTLLLCGLPSFAFAGGTPLNLDTQSVLSPDYCPHQMTGTAAYAFSKALSGTTSAPIDLGLVGCFTFSVTGSGSAKIDIYQSNNSTTYTAGTTNTAGTLGGWFAQGNANAQKTYAWPKKGGRYVWFFIEPVPPGGPYVPNSVTPVASSTTLWYYLPTNWPN